MNHKKFSHRIGVIFGLVECWVCKPPVTEEQWELFWDRFEMRQQRARDSFNKEE